MGAVLELPVLPGAFQHGRQPRVRHDDAKVIVQLVDDGGIVQEVRECGTTKIKLKSWSPGTQEPTAYLMPESYTILVVSE